MWFKEENTVITIKFLFLFGFLGGFIVGLSIGWIFTRRKILGTLRVDTSDRSEAPLVFLEFAKAPEQLKDGERFEVVVSTQSYLPQDEQPL